jgi:hypothetical protein
MTTISVPQAGAVAPVGVLNLSSPQAKGLRMCFPGAEGGGEVLRDVYGGFTGAFAQNGAGNSPKWASLGQVGNVFYNNFNLYNGAFPILDSFHPTEYTLSMWVVIGNLSGGTSTYGGWVRTTSGGPTSAWSHQIGVGQAGSVQYAYAYTYYGTGSATIVGTTPIVQGKMYHFCVTAKNGGSMHLYVNGREDGTPAATSGTLWTGGDRWYIGGTQSNFNSTSLQCCYWDLRYYSLEKTAGEVAEMYEEDTRWDLYRPPSPRRGVLSTVAPPSAITYRRSFHGVRVGSRQRM